MAKKAITLSKLKDKTLGKKTKKRKAFDVKAAKEISIESISPSRRKEIEKEFKQIEESFKETESVKISKIILDKIRLHKKGSGVSIRSFIELSVMSKLPKRIAALEINEMIDMVLDVKPIKKKRK